MDDLDIFSAAMELSTPEERESFLREACGDNASLRERIEALLQSSDKVSRFMESPALAIESPSTIDQPISEKPGDAIGPYKLLQQIGEGGMGVVYMAEQTKPVERRVALKIIKPGMDTRQVIARFEAERQALAMMDHPNIAKVLDAGTTQAGRPYFVMELVKGTPITEYCDEHHLTPQQRLELFIPACQAIQHAHQKGIIHRDIKPSNVLVAHYDDQPVPKIIDFGVAKAIDHRLTEKTMFTEYGQVLGTLEYMSPEQARFNQWDVDTRSDVYSLGVLLYELLSGETPFDRERLRSAAFDELLRIIKEEEPPCPSLRLSTSESLPSIAANRLTDPEKLSTLVRGELDWIVMKALEKDRNRRYETVGNLAEDVRHYLNDEPVEACPPSTAYRLRKFARRHKPLITTITAISAALLVGVGLAAWQAVRATSERKRAELAEATAQQEAQRAVEEARSALFEKDKAQTTVALLEEMLAVTNPERVRRRDYTVVQLLDEFAVSLDRQSQELLDHPEVEIKLRQTLGEAYRKYGQAKKGRPHLERSLELITKEYGEGSVQYADAVFALGVNAAKTAWSGGQEEERRFRRALSVYRDKGEQVRELDALKNLIENDLAQSRMIEAVQVAEEALRTAEQHDLNDSTQVTSIISSLARAKSALGDHSAAVRLINEASSRRDRLHNYTSKDNGWHWLNAGRVLRDAGLLEEAEKCFRKSIDSFRTAHSAAPQGNEGRAIVQLIELLEDKKESETVSDLLEGFAPEMLTVALTNAAHAELQRQRNPQRAIRKLRKAVDLVPDGSDADFLAWWSVTDPYSPYRKSGEGIALAKIATDTEPEVPEYWTTLGVAYFRAGQVDAAVESLNRATELSGKPDAINSLFLAMAHWKLGHKQKAREFYDDSAGWEIENVPNDEETRRFRSEAAELLGIDDSALSASTTDD